MDHLTDISTTDTEPRLCNWGGVYHPEATIVDVDGQWCSDACQSLDRMSEYRQWRKARAVAA